MYTCEGVHIKLVRDTVYVCVCVCGDDYMDGADKVLKNGRRQIVDPYRAPIQGYMVPSYIAYAIDKCAAALYL
jgi:hypothetical protein